MKKKSLFLGGALMFAMTFSTTVLTSCHDDDKKYEEVEDPLRSQTAYYIAGTITDANGPLAGATVKSGEYSATTDAKGVYSLTVNKTGIYINPEKPDVPLNKNDAFQKVQKRRVQEKR